MTEVRTAGSAHRGLGEWLVQRVTALYLAGFTFYLVVYFTMHPIPDHAAWLAYFAAGPARLAWWLAVVSTLMHAWIGLRSIYMDYLRPFWLRFGVMMLTALGLLALGTWATEILLQAAA